MTSLGESTYEAVFDHGNEGYGVWFDGMVKDDPVYKRSWKGNRPIFVRLEEDQIIISRTLPGRDEDQNDDSANEDVPDVGNAVSVQMDFDDDAPAFVMDPDPADDLDGDSQADGDERVYSPEEAAQLFAAEAADAADAAEAAADAADAASAEADAPAKPKSPPARRRVSTRKKKPAADKDA
jgi:hypothetical protein